MNIKFILLIICIAFSQGVSAQKVSSEKGQTLRDAVLTGLHLATHEVAIVALSGEYRFFTDDDNDIEDMEFEFWLKPNLEIIEMEVEGENVLYASDEKYFSLPHPLGVEVESLWFHITAYDNDRELVYTGYCHVNGEDLKQNSLLDVIVYIQDKNVLVSAPVPEGIPLEDTHMTIDGRYGRYDYSTELGGYDVWLNPSMPEHEYEIWYNGSIVSTGTIGSGNYQVTPDGSQRGPGLNLKMPDNVTVVDFLNNDNTEYVFTNVTTEGGETIQLDGERQNAKVFSVLRDDNLEGKDIELSLKNVSSCNVAVFAKENGSYVQVGDTLTLSSSWMFLYVGIETREHRNFVVVVSDVKYRSVFESSFEAIFRPYRGEKG